MLSGSKCNSAVGGYSFRDSAVVWPTYMRRACSAHLQCGQVGVGEGVHADGMALARCPPDDVGIAWGLELFSNNKKRCLDAEPGQIVQ
jgi:hypothetical protein